MHQVELMVRQSCGSCRRVAKQIRPICHRWGAGFVVTDVDSDTSLAMEFGDRVPVVLVDDDEIACWEIDDEDLIAALEA